MAKLSKRMKNIREKVNTTKLYPVNDALSLIKEFSETTKFVQTIEISFNLGIDARKSDQGVRGASVLPHGTGRSVRVAVFAEGKTADEAKEAGADIVGFEDLAESVKGGKMDFDVVIATPGAMRIVGTLGQVLGPRGLMPNPKVGTVTQQVGEAVRNAKAGQVRYRADKAGIVHCIIGKANFSVEHLKENLVALVNDIKKAKPSTSKGVYLKKLTLSSTMGPGLTIDQSTLWE